MKPIYPNNKRPFLNKEQKKAFYLNSKLRIKTISLEKEEKL